jgi:hypothetical protein
MSRKLSTRLNRVGFFGSLQKRYLTPFLGAAGSGVQGGESNRQPIPEHRTSDLGVTGRVVWVGGFDMKPVENLLNVLRVSKQTAPNATDVLYQHEPSSRTNEHVKHFETRKQTSTGTGVMSDGEVAFFSQRCENERKIQRAVPNLPKKEERSL